jgi:hypothetical protein
MTDYPIGARVIVHPDSPKPIPARIVSFEEYLGHIHAANPETHRVCVRADDPSTLVGWVDGYNAWAPEFAPKAIKVLYDVCAECEGVCEPNDYLCGACRG